MQTRLRSAGFTLIEIALVLAIIAFAASLAVTRMQQWAQNGRLREAARATTDALLLARAEALRTGSNQMVFFGAAGGTDPCGTPLQDVNGNPVPLVILNDGPNGAPTQNCCIDPGETRSPIPAEIGVLWGSTFAGAPAPGDTGAGPIAGGVSFTDPNGVATNWVLFRPDGLPAGVTAACVQGSVGTGGGGVYVTNGFRDYGAVLSPLGGIKVYTFERNAGAWQ